MSFFLRASISLCSVLPLALACATPARAPAAQLERSVFVDGTFEVDAPLPAVRSACEGGLQAVGLVVDEGVHDDLVITTTRRRETIERWRWLRAVNPPASTTAAAAAALASGGIFPASPTQSTSTDGEELEVFYTITLVEADGTTTVAVEPHALHRFDDVTDIYVARVLGPEDTRHRLTEIGDAIRSALAAAP